MLRYPQLANLKHTLWLMLCPSPARCRKKIRKFWRVGITARLYCENLYIMPLDRCWRCDTHKEILLHIWWEYSLIRLFWKKVLDCNHNLTAESPSRTSQVVLLSSIPSSRSKTKRGLLRFFLIASRMVIPRHWTTSSAPSAKEWARELDHHMHMEELTAKLHYRYDSFASIWHPWIQLKESPSFAEMIAWGRHSLAVDQEFSLLQSLCWVEQGCLDPYLHFHPIFRQNILC